jgi:hypothetical protein
VKPPVKLSKTQGKKLLNAVLVKSKQHSTDYEAMQLREAETSRKLSNACAVLEAIVRRYGTQVFDRKELEGLCAAGRIKWEVGPDRITLRLLELQPVLDAEKVH